MIEFHRVCVCIFWSHKSSKDIDIWSFQSRNQSITLCSYSSVSSQSNSRRESGNITGYSLLSVIVVTTFSPHFHQFFTRFYPVFTSSSPHFDPVFTSFSPCFHIFSTPFAPRFYLFCTPFSPRFYPVYLFTQNQMLKISVFSWKNTFVEWTLASSSPSAFWEYLW